MHIYIYICVYLYLYIYIYMYICIKHLGFGDVTPILELKQRKMPSNLALWSGFRKYITYCQYLGYKGTKGGHRGLLDSYVPNIFPTRCPCPFSISEIKIGAHMDFRALPFFHIQSSIRLGDK